MRRWRILFYLIAFAFSLPCAHAGGVPEISVKAEVDRASITIGEPVLYTVTIRRLPSVQILSRIPPPDAELFKVKTIQEFKEEEGGVIAEGRRFTLTAFQLGEYILDPIEIQYRKEAGEVETIETSRIFLTVRSVSGDEEKTDIRGMKSVLSIPARIMRYLIIFLVFVLAVIVFFLFLRWKKRSAQPVPEAARLSPEEEALTALSQLFDSDWIRKGKVREYFFVMSEILRVYFERRYRILAVESTTAEIIALLKPLDLDRPLRQKIQSVLENADLAKFAKWKPEPAEVLTLNKQSREIVEESAPKEEVRGV